MRRPLKGPCLVHKSSSFFCVVFPWQLLFAVSHVCFLPSLLWTASSSLRSVQLASAAWLVLLLGPEARCALFCMRRAVPFLPSAASVERKRRLAFTSTTPTSAATLTCVMERWPLLPSTGVELYSASCLLCFFFCGDEIQQSAVALMALYNPHEVMV